MKTPIFFLPKRPLNTYRLLKIWLAALACQHASLLSDNDYHPSYDNFDSLYTQWETFEYTPEYQITEEWNTPLYYDLDTRDASSHSEDSLHDFQSNSYFSSPSSDQTSRSQYDLKPENGHWPTFTNNESYYHYDEPFFVEEEIKATHHTENHPVEKELTPPVSSVPLSPPVIAPKGETLPAPAPETVPSPTPPSFSVDKEIAQIETPISSSGASTPPPLSPLNAFNTPIAPIATPSSLVAPETTRPFQQVPEKENVSLPPVLEPISPPSHPVIITPTTPSLNGDGRELAQTKTLKEIGSINFNNVAMVEYIRFISRISNKNFIFDEEDLQFNVTIVSEESTTIENLMMALLQELRIRNLSLIEQGNNIIIHRNGRIRSPARIVMEENNVLSAHDSELVTRVFRLNTLDPAKASDIIRPLLSDDALIEVLKDTNNLIITDLVSNVNKIAQLINTLDAPNSGVTIGQYVVRNTFVDALIDLANKILQPIAQGNPFVLVPHPVSNSIFIVSNSFIVEKALAILQNLDLNEGKTKILSLEKLQPSYEKSFNEPSSSGQGIGGAAGGVGGLVNGSTPGFAPGGVGQEGGLGQGGVGQGGFGQGGQQLNPANYPNQYPFGGLNNEGRGLPFPVSNQLNPLNPGGIATEGRENAIFHENRGFQTGGIASEGRPSAIFHENRSFEPGGIGASSRWSNELPVGHIERTLFYIYKLRYRKGDNIEIALRKIANSLQAMGSANADLVSAINSSQWIESSNSLIFTGTATALDKVRELITEVDTPLRQIFIEMLILDTTILDSLSYSVEWIDRFGGGGTTGEEGFISASPGTGIVSTDQFVSASQTIFNNGSVAAPAAASPLPVATNFLNSGGFVAGIIGTHLTHGGTQFSSIGALVRAIHSDAKADILLNPKIITEDNNPAEIFVGGVDRYKTQSITNDLGSLVTNNFQFIDVGTTLRVTPLIGSNDVITLDILQETTNEAATANIPGGGENQDVNLVPVLTKTRTTTRVHVPNGFFVVLSGMIKDNQTRTYSRIPCLGGIPIIGCWGKSQRSTDNKRNLMLFIRPLIIDTDDDYEDVTKRQQDVYREKSKFRRSWNYEIDEALNFANVKSTDPDDMNCQCSDREQP